MSIAAKSTSMNYEIKKHLAQLEKIVQLIKIVSKLAIPSIQAQVLITSIEKLFPMFKDQDRPSCKKDQGSKLSSSKIKWFSCETGK